MKKAFKYIITGIVCFAIGFGAYRAFTISTGNFSKTSLLLGTVVEIQVKPGEDNIQEAVDSAFSEIKRLDKLFSAYDSTSPVYRINDKCIGSIDISEYPEIYHLIEKSMMLGMISSGAFDAGIGNITDLWGFNNQKEKSLPDSLNITAAMQNSGIANIVLSKDNLVKNKPIKLNFDAIAKGYAVDKAWEVLTSFGINNFLINAGGEIRANGRDWKIGIKHPRNQGMLCSVNPAGMALATSGDYENYFFAGGRRYCHIINPETGYPADQCQSVTVISRDVMTADALATAVFVLGSVDGLALVNQMDNTECLIVDKNGKLIKSDDFENYIRR